MFILFDFPEDFVSPRVTAINLFSIFNIIENARLFQLLWHFPKENPNPIAKAGQKCTIAPDRAFMSRKRRFALSQCSVGDIWENGARTPRRLDAIRALRVAQDAGLDPATIEVVIDRDGTAL
jgi:hypothetical protein